MKYKELEIDTGVTCLCWLAAFHGHAVDPHQIIHEFKTSNRAFDTPDILLAAKSLGLKAKSVKITPDRLPHTPLPAMVKKSEGGFFVLARVDKKMALIQDPKQGKPQLVPLETLLRDEQNLDLILLAKKDVGLQNAAKFDFTWFIPIVVKYRRLFGEVLMVSFVLQCIALATPLFFQVIVDKILVHKGLATLDVVAIGFLCVVLFEVALSVLRSFVFSHTTNRVDVELGAKLFRHLLKLPFSYFQARRVGDSVARVRELENIRAFLTGHAITSVLDLFFSFFFIGILFYYNPWLATIVVLSLPVYVLLSLFFTPLLRKHLQEKFNRGADNQAFLVETISGVATAKSMALEPELTRKWDGQLAGYVTSSFKANTTALFANQSIVLMSKIASLLIIWMGARLVMKGELTVGQLIAFNMLAGYITSPMIRLAQLWTDFQQTGISVERLGDILNTHPEMANQKIILPALRGQISFEHVSFRYHPNQPTVLKSIQLDIKPGEIIGIVGKSGSGKSTLTKLIQRLYLPESGRILIDGIDLAVADTSSLRRQLGVVMQDDILFQGSIRENISLRCPGVALEQVIAAAKLAGAHDFIVKLPESYQTPVGEQGATLSGGQRQRLALARALITNPRILILDEATSALDYESERIIQHNMRFICKGRTVIIVAHRLSAVRLANRIIVLEEGEIIESGTHEKLIDHQQGHYAKLYQLQFGD